MRGSVHIQMSVLALIIVTFFVSMSGNDTGSGSAAAPWRTIQHAADRVAPGDTVVVREGAYKGFFLDKSGTEKERIVFHADHGAVINDRNFKTADGINLERASYITIEGFTIDNAGGKITRAGIRSVNNNHVIVHGNAVDSAGTWGFLSGFSDDLLVEANVFSRSNAEHGIYVSNSGDRPVIRGNVSWGNNGCGIHMNGDKSMGGDGIISGALVEDNVIYENGRRGGSGINADGVQKSRFQNNVLYDNHSSGISLYRTDGAEPSRDNVVVNNTVIVASDGRWALNIMNGSTGNTVLNNILYNRHPSHGSVSISRDSLPGLVSDFNVLMQRLSNDDGDRIMSLAQWRKVTGQDQHSLVAAPAALFVKPEGHDFVLAAASPALGAGTASQAPKKDRKGSPRPTTGGVDIGADQHQDNSR